MKFKPPPLRPFPRIPGWIYWPVLLMFLVATVWLSFWLDNWYIHFQMRH